MPRKRLTGAFLLVIFALMLVVEPSPVHAAPSLVQQNKTYCMSNWSPAPCTSATMSVSFASSVASGDVVLVGVHSGSSISITVSSVSDSLGSSFTQAVMSSSGFTYEYIYYATLSSSGSDQITVTFSSPPTQLSTVFYVFIYEVSGVTTTGATTGTGAGDYGVPVSTTPTAFQSGAFLLAIIGNNIMSTGVTPGSGFTLIPDDSASEILGIAHVQYSTSGVSSPTTFPATFSQSNKWVEAGIALNPSPPYWDLEQNGVPVTTLQVAVGGMFTVDVWIRGISSSDGLTSLYLDVKWDPTMMALDSHEETSNTHNWDEWQVEYISVDTIDFYAVCGYGGCPSESVVIEDVMLLSLHFRCLSQGSSQVTIPEVYLDLLSGDVYPPAFIVTCNQYAAPVGGVVISANNFAIATSWLAIIGLFGSLGTVAVVAKKRRR